MGVMFRRFAITLLAVLVAAHFSLRGDDVEGLREFTDKRGQKIEARLLGVSEDRKIMHIVRGDGVEFDSEINLLSLDDQQFVKDWLKQATATPPVGPVPTDDYRLDVQIARTNGESTEHRESYYKFDCKENLYRVTVRNLSRQPLEGARIEFAIVWSDNAIVYQQKENQEWVYTTGVYDDSTARVKRLGERPLEALRYNAGISVETDAVPIDRVLYDGREVVYEDELLGIKVRVLSSTGQVLHESELGGAGIGTLTWEQVSAFPDPRRYD